MYDQTNLIKIINCDLAQIFEKEKISAYQRYCVNFTLKSLFTTDSVYISAIRCSSGFMNKKDTQRFMKRPWMNSYILCQKVLNHKFKPTYYSTRKINERGKERIIKPPTFECKVVQKVICDYLIRPLLEPKMINTNYASVKEKGTSKMYEDICKELNNKIRNNIDFDIVIFDYKGYFASIPISKLLEQLSRYIYDVKIINLIQEFSPDEFGLSLGNELSQIPASWYPSPVDHIFKDKMQMSKYRYMDDSLIISDPIKTEKVIQIYQKESERLGLHCPDSKVKVYHSQHSFTFCKERFVWNKKQHCYNRLINPQIPGKEKHKLIAFKKFKKKNKITNFRIQQQSNGVIGTISNHPHTWKERKQLEVLQFKAIC